MNRKEKNALLKSKQAENIAKQQREAWLEAMSTFTVTTGTSVHELTKSLTALQESIAELSGMETHEELQYTFTDWERFLDMTPERLPRLTHTTVESLFTDSGLETHETVPEPNTLYALTHQPGAIYQVSPTEWYCESGKTKDTEGGAGYLVKRTYVSAIQEFRWFCTCVQGKKNMYTGRPYCKHMYAVANWNLNRGGLHQWVKFPYKPDVIEWLQRSVDHGHFEDSDFELNDYLNAFK